MCCNGFFERKNHRGKIKKSNESFCLCQKDGRKFQIKATIKSRPKSALFFFSRRWKNASELLFGTFGWCPPTLWQRVKRTWGTLLHRSNVGDNVPTFKGLRGEVPSQVTKNFGITCYTKKIGRIDIRRAMK